MPCGTSALQSVFGGIDIYLFDQLQRGVITPDMRVLDAGCGGGRNLHYLLSCGAEVYGVDRDAEAIERLRQRAADLGPALPDDRLQVAVLDALPFADEHFHAVICSAVLHFADHKAHFASMLTEMWRVLAPGGVLFIRLGSTIGVEDVVRPVGSGRYTLPTGVEWFLVDRALLEEAREALGAVQLDPIKTTNVEDRRAMTTWVLEKPERSQPST